MQEYRAPLRDMRFAMQTVGGLATLRNGARSGDLTADLADAVLEEAARFAERELVPLYRTADRAGAKLVGGAVQTASGMPAAYAEFARGGWVGLAAPRGGRRARPAELDRRPGRGDLARSELGVRALPDAHAIRDRGTGPTR